LTSERETGAAAVEFALIFPLLVLLLFGIFEFGRAYNVQIQLSAAAREGVRVMAIQNDAVAARSATRAAAPAISPALTDAEISVVPATCSSGNTVTVTAVRPVSYDIPLFGSSTFNLEGVGVMRCGG
jgi:Flp pilus assembly protein TadG